MTESLVRNDSAASLGSRAASAPLEQMDSLQNIPPPSLTKSATFTLSENQFGFQSKTSFDANKELQKYRSLYFQLPPVRVDNDIWKRSAPDFRPQGYAPRPPKRNSRDAMKPWLYGTIPGQNDIASRKKKQKSRHSFKEKEDEEEVFLTKFHIMDPQEARIDFVRSGVYKPLPYKMPKYHDYRDYPSLASLGLIEFDTTYEKDPYNINFNSKRLRILKDAINAKAPTERDIKGQQMAPPLFQPTQWQEMHLILPKTKFPESYNAYTRFRRTGRTAHSALMDRVEETLSTKWSKEKLEKALEEEGNRKKEREERERMRIQKQLMEEEKKKKEKRSKKIVESC